MDKKEQKHDKTILKQSHEDFCQHYVLTGENATKSALEAGFKKKSASVQASRLLKKDNIIQRIKEIRAEKMKALDIDEEKLIKKYKNIANANLLDFIEIGESIRYSKNGEPYSVDIIRLKDLDKVDSSLIKSMHMKDGSLRLELYSSKDAMDKLYHYFGLGGEKESDENNNIIFGSKKASDHIKKIQEKIRLKKEKLKKENEGIIPEEVSPNLEVLKDMEVEGE